MRNEKDRIYKLREIYQDKSAKLLTCVIAGWAPAAAAANVFVVPPAGQDELLEAQVGQHHGVRPHLPGRLPRQCAHGLG